MSAGRDLSKIFFERTVRPIIEPVLSGAGYLAGRLGSGSDVLGFDTDRSPDHDFGCRLTVLVDDGDRAQLGAIDAALASQLPDEVDGWPTRFATTWKTDVGHQVDLGTVHDFAHSRLGFDLRSTLHAAEWLCLTGQSVLEVVGGPVFHDGTVAYGEVRAKLEWYPSDIWRFALAAGWARLGQEVPFVGRTGELDDDAGCRIIAARLCRDIVHLAFLAERTWMPYPKWSGTALRQLPEGELLASQLAGVQAAASWQERQHLLSHAIEGLADRHRRVGFEMPQEVIKPFFDRPSIVTNDEIPALLTRDIVDQQILAVPPIGTIEQWCDNVDVLANPRRRAAAAAMYRPTRSP